MARPMPCAAPVTIATLPVADALINSSPPCRRCSCVTSSARQKGIARGSRMAALHRIDVHHHVTPPSLRNEKMRAGAGGGPTYGWTLDKTLEDMEKGDVRGVVISMPYPVDIWPNPKDT